tara:strand:- start:183 stop:602 length:420 start_codon:yes stop_codon:yes gene_type:complete
MADSVDVLFINPGDRKQIYQGLGDEFSAIEPPVFAGLFATYVRRKGHRVAIYDAPAMMASADEVARVATEDFNAKPLSNRFCTAAEILEFRDNAFDQYFTSPTCLKMVKEKFGQDVVDHIFRMVSIPLSRKLLEERTAA